jgi:outer membrane receptor protein involved in Fe transport
MYRSAFVASLLAGASLFAFAAPAAAQSDTAPAARPGSATTTKRHADQAEAKTDVAPTTEVGEVIVTGSRIVRNGYQSPTPVTVLTAQELAEKSPGNIPDALNQLPQFVRSYSQYTGKHTSTNFPIGNFLNLRGLGTTRSLILFDGQRVPPTSYDGSVDINTLPQFLIQRVDIVTGGASAAYGSDAVVGVVNFVLDKKFEGLKASAQVGQSNYGDAESYKVAVAAGHSFFDDRLHLLGSAEAYRNEGVPSRLARPPYDDRYVLTGTGTAANPYTLNDNVRYNSVSFGGLIRSGPLAGYTFLPNGDIKPFDKGTPTGSAGLQIGGDGGYFADSTLAGSLRTDQLFGRASFDLTPKTEIYGQVSYGESRNTFYGAGQYNFAPSSAAITIFSDNAFLLPSIRDRLGSTSSFLLGRIANDFPKYLNSSLNDSIYTSVGINSGFGKTWKWGLNYSHGDSRLRGKSYEGENRKLFAAVDAVRDPQGNIVCRVTLTNPGLYPGCVPLDLFGEGAPSQQALQYVLGQSEYEAVNKVDIVSANITGDPFSLWAGPVSVAFGAEFRKQHLVQTSNSDHGEPLDFTGIRGVPTNAVGFNLLNMSSASGSVNVKEAYGEVVVPLLVDKPFVHRLELNSAFRLTDYSTSGTVNTWKIGLNYEPNDELKLRATVSRDIRAPSLYELYNGGQVVFISFNDIHTGTTSVLGIRTAGNPDLKPEIGSTLVGGVVYSPHWLPGFTASIDAYEILINDAIAQTNQSQQNLDCELSGGKSSVCNLITRPLPFSDTSPANFPTGIRVAPQNLSKIYQTGVDFESSYSLPLDRLRSSWNGDLDFRLLLTYMPTVNTKLDAKSATVRSGGYYGNPKLRGNFTVDYRNGPFHLGAQARMTGKFLLATGENTEVYKDHGYAPNVVYVDLTGSYDFKAFGAKNTEAFITINNLFNRIGPIRVDRGQSNPGLSYPTLREYYDFVGRYVTVGVRFRM